MIRSMYSFLKNIKCDVCAYQFGLNGQRMCCCAAYLNTWVIDHDMLHCASKTDTHPKEFHSLFTLHTSRSTMRCIIAQNHLNTAIQVRPGALKFICVTVVSKVIVCVFRECVLSCSLRQSMLQQLSIGHASSSVLL